MNRLGSNDYFQACKVRLQSNMIASAQDLYDLYRRIGLGKRQFVDDLMARDSRLYKPRRDVAAFRHTEAVLSCFWFQGSTRDRFTTIVTSDVGGRSQQTTLLIWPPNDNKKEMLQVGQTCGSNMVAV